MARGHAAHLPRRRARRGQDLRHARTRAGARASAGTDVVVGFVETHGRAEHRRRRSATSRSCPAHTRRVPRRAVRGDGRRRRPRPQARRSRWSTSSRTPTCPGSRNEKRWQDVEELLDAGIDVISTVNIQHLESVNDVVERITGIKQRETMPDAVVRRGRPDRARRHDARGAAAADGARQHLPGREGRRRARQLLPRRQPRRAARAGAAVGRRPGRRGAAELPRGPRHRRPWETRERVVVAITGAPGGDDLIRRAARMATRATRRAARRARARRPTACAGPSSERARARSARCSRSSAASTTRSSAPTSPTALVQFARAENATQLVLGASRRSRWTELLRGSVINTCIRASGDHRRPRDLDGGRRRRRAPDAADAPRRRPTASRLAGAAGCWPGSSPSSALPLLTLRPGATCAARSTLPSDLLLFLLVVVVVAAIGGFVPAFVCRDRRVPARQLVLHAARTTRSRSPRARTSSRS